MKIRVEHGDYDENEIVLYCKALDDEVLEALSLLRERSIKIAANKDGEIHVLKPGDILFIEAVDGKTFLYTAKAVLETSQSLMRIEELHGDAGFLRIGKSQLVNLFHVAKLRSMPNSRIEITLQNNEKLIVSRHYVQDLKEKLRLV